MPLRAGCCARSTGPTVLRRSGCLASTTTRRPAAGRSFLPPSANVVEPYRLTPRLALRVGILGVVTLAVFAALFLRLWALEVLQGTHYLKTAENNQLRTVRLQAPRG